jgi:choline dehydrogenase-like flavoprotein
VDTSDGLHADLLVIGFGKGGKTVAATMRRLGRRVVLASPGCAREPAHRFRAKAGRVLDLYAWRWEGRRLHPGDYVISADEKTQLQALLRRQPLVALARAGPDSSSTSTAAAGRWPIWPRWTSTTPPEGCSVAARSRSATRRSTRSSNRS